MGEPQASSPAMTPRATRRPLHIDAGCMVPMVLFRALLARLRVQDATNQKCRIPGRACCAQENEG
jgi:hypothetical protein